MTSRVTLTALAVTFVVFNASIAQAQTYKGDAYGANIGLQAVLVGVDATIVDNPNLPAAGGGPLTNQLLNANIQAQTAGPLPNLFTVLGAGVINTSTVGTGGVATSVSEITGLNLLPGFGISVPLVGTITLSDSLVRADVIRSTTTANALGNSGTTEIANLRFGGTSLGNLNIANAVPLTYYLNLAGGVSTTASTNILVPDVVQLTINGQSTSDGGLTRTTNALQVSVLPQGQLLSGNVVVASSSAGFAPAATVVPESGTLTLLGSALPALAGLIAIRARRLRRKSA